MNTSNSAVSICPSEGWKHRTTIVIPIDPRPTPRPILTAAGVRNPVEYQKYKQEAIRAIGRGNLGIDRHTEVWTDVEVVCRRPKTPSRLYPSKGDTDSLIKAAWDVITQAGGWWDDDVQITEVSGRKRYADKGETPHTRVEVYSR